MTCIFEDTFLASDRFLTLALHSMTALEVPIHIFGVYLILSKTPRSMSSVKYSILQLHCFCAFMDFFLCFLLTFYMWIPAPAGYPVGLLTYLGMSSHAQIYMHFMTLTAVGVSYLAFFENRYDALVIGFLGRAEYRNIKRIAYFTANFLFFWSATTYIFLEMPDTENGRKGVRKSLPCIPETFISNEHFVNMNVYSKIVPIITISMVTVGIVQGAYFVLYTTYFLFFSVRHVSQVTQRMQKKFFIAMMLQAFVPLAAFVGPIYYYYLAFSYNYLNQKYNNIAMIVSGFNGFLTTIVMILVQEPYRRAVLDLFSVRFVMRPNGRVSSSIVNSIT